MHFPDAHRRTAAVFVALKRLRAKGLLVDRMVHPGESGGLTGMTEDHESHGPPRVARWLLSRKAGPAQADEVRHELDELFGDRVETQGMRVARRWYWRQVVAFAFRFRQLIGNQAGRDT